MVERGSGSVFGRQNQARAHGIQRYSCGGLPDTDIITVDGVRVDTSGKKAGDEIMAHISRLPKALLMAL